MGCLLLFSGLPSQWCFRVVVAPTADKMYCLGVLLVVYTLRTVASSLVERSHQPFQGWAMAFVVSITVWAQLCFWRSAVLRISQS